MWWVVVGLLLVLWLLGLSSAMTFGGFIHLLLVAAILVAAVRLQTQLDRRARQQSSG